MRGPFDERNEGSGRSGTPQQGELGRTVVLVVHDVNVASCYSDRIVAMREGQLVAEGPTADLMTPELLREVFDVEVEVHELAGRRIGVPWS